MSDEYRTLPDMEDRLFSTIVTADWTYGRWAAPTHQNTPTGLSSLSLNSSLDYDSAHAVVEAAVLEVFAGPADKVVATVQ